MSLEKILEDNTEFVNLSFKNYQQVISKKLTTTFNPNKTWSEMGLDDLDLVEMVMELEKQFDFAFPDLLFDDIFGLNVYPIDFNQISRNKKIDKLLD